MPHVILNISHSCNLACSYCYYQEEMQSKPGIMNMDVIEKIIRGISESSRDNFVVIIHGGEPLTRPWSFYKELLALEREYAQNKKVKTIFQTNGTLIDEGFTRNYHEASSEGHDLGIGISLDGIKDLHDTYRRYRSSGKGSYEDVINGLALLSNKNIRFGILSVASDGMVECLEDIYRFFKTFEGLNSLDFITPHANGETVILSKGNLGTIYNGLFDLWFNDREATFKIRRLNSIVASMLGASPGLCEFLSNCMLINNVISVSVDGEVSFCDCFPGTTIGNVFTDSLDYLLSKSNRKRKSMAVHEEKRIYGCIHCEWLKLCRGGCPIHYNPEIKAHYYCDEYKKMYSHIFTVLNKSGLIGEKRITADAVEQIPNPVLRRQLQEILFPRRTNA